MDKKLLIDKAGFVKMTLEESAGGRLKMRGEFGKADVPTENRRIYPKNVWKKEIDRIQESIKAGKVFGHIEHPSDGKTNLAKVSHIVTDLYMEDDGRIIGEAVILNNDHGRQLKSILEAGGAIGVSSRGMGSTSTNGEGFEVVQEDFSYITHDCVADPAVKTSYPSFVEEGAAKAGNIKESNMAVEEKVETYTKEQVEEMIKASNEFVKAEITDKMMVESAKLKEKLEKEIRESLMKDPAIAEAKEKLEQIKESVAPIIQTADVEKAVNEAVASKVKQIALLQSKLAAKEKEFEALEENVVDALNGAKRLAIQLEYEREANKFGDAELFRKMMGEAKEYKSSEEISKAVLVAKKSLSESRRQERIAAAKAKRMEESLKRKVVSLESEVEEKNKSLEEALVKEKEEMAKLYAEHALRGNPNAPKLRRLVEGVTDKNKIDEIISQYNVATPNAELYNSIRGRFEGLRNTTLVESQLGQETKKETAVVESVDDEINQILR